VGAGRTEQTGAHGAGVLADAAEGLDAEGDAVDFADF
jgi:hypothetical protein